MRDMHDDGDDDGPATGERFKEFECPDCNAHNPADDGFTVGDEVLCCYCGMEFKAKLSAGRLKLKPL
jgi:transcription elongation factor Elf1